MEIKDVLAIWEFMAKKMRIPKESLFLTGSYSLKLLGILNRECKDLDFIIFVMDEDHAQTLKSRLKPKASKSGMYTSFVKRGIHVDIFFDTLLPNHCDITLNGMRILNPIDTLKVKLEYNNKKSIDDFKNIISRVLPNVRQNKQLDNLEKVIEKL